MPHTYVQCQVSRWVDADYMRLLAHSFEQVFAFMCRRLRPPQTRQRGRFGSFLAASLASASRSRRIRWYARAAFPRHVVMSDRWATKQLGGLILDLRDELTGDARTDGDHHGLEGLDEPVATHG